MVYHTYPLNTIANRNMGIFIIRHILTGKIRVKTNKKKYFQFHLTYIIYSHILIHEPIMNSILDIHKDYCGAKTVSNIVKCLKIPTSITLLLIIL